MKCEWDALVSILPLWLGEEVNAYKDTLREIRLRLGQKPELKVCGSSRLIDRTVVQKDIYTVLNYACHFSPWAMETTKEGYLTALGGHRIGLCGNLAVNDGTIQGYRNVQSLCIRVCREYPGIAEKMKQETGSILILGAPGWGKTTFLRDLCRQKAKTNTVGVVDERLEIFPSGIEGTERLDVLRGCGKCKGIELLLRTMAPDYLAFDEITASWDAEAALKAKGCGVKLLATAHAGSFEEYCSNVTYKPLINNRVFDKFVILKPDNSYDLRGCDS